MINKKKSKRSVRVLILVTFLILNALYKRFIEHTSGPDYGKPNELLSIVPSTGFVAFIDIVMAITGLIAFIWLIVELVAGFIGLFRKKPEIEHEAGN